MSSSPLKLNPVQVAITEDLDDLDCNIQIMCDGNQGMGGESVPKRQGGTPRGREGNLEVRGRGAGLRSHGRAGPRELATISSEGPARYIPLPAGGGGQPLIWPVQISCIVASCRSRPRDAQLQPTGSTAGLAGPLPRQESGGNLIMGQRVVFGAPGALS